MHTEFSAKKTPLKEEPGFIAKLAIQFEEKASFIGKKGRSYAQLMHERNLIYWLYSLIDGPQVGWSTIKWFFEILYANAKESSSDAMSDWMATPTGMAMAASEVAFFTLYSLLGTVFSDSDPNVIKRLIAQSWSYARDLTKIKNSTKGIKNLILVLNSFGGADLNFLLLPLALPIGVVAISNRLWFRYIKNKRIAMMKANAELLALIQMHDSLSAEECDAFRLKMQKNMQTTTTRVLGLLSQFVSGSIDSLYLYVGVLSIASLAMPALAPMVLLCAAYSVVCVFSRMYEEYDYQRKLLITHAKIELNLYKQEFGSEMHECFTRLHRLSKLVASCDDQELLDALLEEQFWLAKNLTEKITTFCNKRAHLQSLLLLSNTSAFLAGAKSGLAAYGALASVMFAISTLLAFTSVGFPPALLVAGISMGTVLIAGFIAHSMISNYRHRVKQAKENNKFSGRLSDVMQILRDVKSNKVEEISEVEVKQIMIKSMAVPPPPQSSAPEWSEVLRSLASGPGKIIRLLHQLLAPWQRMDDAGKYHDTPAIMLLLIIASFFESFVLAARALARGFGRPPVDKAPASLASDKSNATTGEDTFSSFEDVETPCPPSFSEESSFTAGTSGAASEKPEFESEKGKSSYTFPEKPTEDPFPSASSKPFSPSSSSASFFEASTFPAKPSKKPSSPASSKPFSPGSSSASFFNASPRKSCMPQDGLTKKDGFSYQSAGLAF